LGQQGQPLDAGNSQQANGVAPGYSPTAGTGLTLNLSSGSALCGKPLAPVTYAGGTLTMTAAKTNFVYLNPVAFCAPASNTSGFDIGQIPIAVVVTNTSTITSVNDVRGSFPAPITMDSTGRAIFKGLNGVYFADQLGDKSSTGIAAAISACGTSTPCQVVVPGSYPKTETVPGYFLPAGGVPRAGTTSGNIQVLDNRYGDFQTAVNWTGAQSGHNPVHNWVSDISLNQQTGYAAHYTANITLNALDGGRVVSNAGYDRKTKAGTLELYLNKWTPETAAVLNSGCYDYSSGDCVPLYGHHYYYGQNISAGGEEGAEVLDAWLYQGSTAYQGTIVSGASTGATSLTLKPTAGVGTQGAERYLIDTAPRDQITAGRITGITPSFPNTVAGSGTSWPVSSVITTTTQAITALGQQTITLASTSGITTSTVLVICDGATFSGQYETVIPTAVGSGTITATFYAPHTSGAIVASGGLSGYFLELTADTVPSTRTGGTAIRQAFPVLYSSSPTSLVASMGSFSSRSTTAWSPSANNSYVLYPGAEVTSVFNAGTVGNTFKLMPNAAPWGPGDTIEEPLGHRAQAYMGTWNFQSWWPQWSASGPKLGFTGIPGLGAYGFYVYNEASPTLYSNGGGGNLYAPLAGYKLQGPWQQGLYFSGFGQGAGGLVMKQGYGNPQLFYPLVAYNTSGGADWLGYNPSTKAWSLSANSQNGAYSFGANVSGGGLIVPGHVGSITSDSQGTVTLTQSLSASVNFSVPFQRVPICTLTPTSDPTSVGAYWVTSTTSAFTVNVHTPGTITFNYVCMGNPN
jgi:hypothetical protein